MFGESPSRMEVKRLQSRLVQMENSLTVAHQAEEKAKEELARLRQVHFRHCQSMLALGHKFRYNMFSCSLYVST